MFGAETLDHVAFPVRDLPRSEKFYIDTVGLTFLTQRKNADGSPRHTYVKAGENIIGLNLPGIQPTLLPAARRVTRWLCGSEPRLTQRSIESNHPGSAAATCASMAATRRSFGRFTSSILMTIISRSA